MCALTKAPRPRIPRQAIYRLSVYLRCLWRLKQGSILTVSSGALAQAAHVKPTQLRKDLAYFGQFGTRGLGYDVAQLSKIISEVLRSSQLRPVILIGVGNLGLALLSYHGFLQEGFEIIASFDNDIHRRRDKLPEQPVFPMENLPEVVRTREVKMAILTVPASAAQEVTNTLVQLGITGILNFSPIVLNVPENVIVSDVNLAIELENLSYFMQK